MNLGTGGPGDVGGGAPGMDGVGGSVGSEHEAGEGHGCPSPTVM